MKITDHLKKLERFTALYAFVSGMDYNHLRGFAENKQKLQCVLLAKSMLNVPESLLSDFFRVPEVLVRKRISRKNEVDVILEMSVKDLEIMNSVEKYWNLEIIGNGKIQIERSA